MNDIFANAKKEMADRAAAAKIAEDKVASDGAQANEVLNALQTEN